MVTPLYKKVFPKLLNKARKKKEKRKRKEKYMRISLRVLISLVMVVTISIVICIFYVGAVTADVKNYDFNNTIDTFFYKKNIPYVAITMFLDQQLMSDEIHAYKIYNDKGKLLQESYSKMSDKPKDKIVNKLYDWICEVKLYTITLADNSRGILAIYGYWKQDAVRYVVMVVYALITIVFFLFFLIIYYIIKTSNELHDLISKIKRIASGDLSTKITYVEDSTHNIHVLANAIENMRRKLEKSKEQQKLFILGISHDLKTPLASISGYATAIKDELYSDKEELDEFATIIENKSNVLLNRILQLVDYIKLDNHNMSGEMIVTDIAKVLTDAIERKRNELKILSPTVKIVLDVHPIFEKSPPIVKLHPILATRLFDNIVENAVKYSNKNNSVTIKLRPIAQSFTQQYQLKGAITPKSLHILHNNISCVDRFYQYELRVINYSDNNDNNSLEKNLQNAFTPFYTTSRATGGTGLGLAVSEYIVDLHYWSMYLTLIDKNYVNTIVLIK